MDSKKIKEIRLLIEKEIEKTNRTIEGYKDMSAPVETDNAIGRLSRMDAINNKSVTEAALRNAEEKLRGLKKALDKLDQPDFGKCSRCGGEIPIQRILFRPQSSLCVKCAH